MEESDLDAVASIAAIGFPDHFEGRDCFANRLALYPGGCFVLAEVGGSPRGYLISYPWKTDAVPALNTSIGAIPSDATVMYLHDLALHPDARGAGHARTIVERVAADARAAGWLAIALVAVNNAAAFWERHGFEIREAPSLRAQLVSYGPDARYMARKL